MGSLRLGSKLVSCDTTLGSVVVLASLLADSRLGRVLLFCLDTGEIVQNRTRCKGCPWAARINSYW